MPHPIQLEPLLTIAEAARVRALLEGALRGSQEALIDGGGVTTIDTAGIQLLVAFCREAECRGIPVRWVAVGKAIPRVASLLGLKGALGLPSEGAADP